ncbi:MAG: hypothetical protein NVSMB51_04290 [Solirubrobacteraceae bacterium]
MRRAAPATLLAAVLAAIYLLWSPPSADLAAALYRSQRGLEVFDLGWYGGFHTLPYSVLMPPLGSLLGVRLLAALSVIAGSACFALVTRSQVAALWFAAAFAVSLGSGRVAFTLGAAVGLASLLASERGRPWIAASLGLLTSLASPLAGAFLALAALRRAPATAGAALAVVAAGALLYPTPGYEPFAPSSFWPALLAVLVLARLLAAYRPVLLLYGAALTLAFALHTPVGGNSVRLGALFAGPLLMACGGPRARAVLALPFAYWALVAPVRDVTRAAGDPSTRASYYAPLLRFAGHPFRIEIPFTANHWEAYRVAGSGLPLARGWERQLDIGRNGLFYAPGSLAPATYVRWLREQAVTLVALPDAKLDASAQQEAQLLRSGRVAGLREVFRSRHWRIWSVADAVPPTSAPATLSGTTPLRLDFTTAGTSELRVRPAGGCLRRAADGFSLVHATRASSITVRFGLDGAACEQRP